MQALDEAVVLLMHSLYPRDDMQRMMRAARVECASRRKRSLHVCASAAVVRTAHADVHRHEKVSNIIKQFKLSCSKTQAQFATMQAAAL